MLFKLRSPFTKTLTSLSDSGTDMKRSSLGSTFLRLVEEELCVKAAEAGRNCNLRLCLCEAELSKPFSHCEGWTWINRRQACVLLISPPTFVFRLKEFYERTEVTLIAVNGTYCMPTHALEPL